MSGQDESTALAESGRADRVVDWYGIETEYRAGVRPVTAIAADFGVSEGAIRKRAKKESWARDLRAQIAAKAEEQVRRAEVREQVRISKIRTERQEIEVAAQMQADIIMRHRRDAPRARELVNRLFSEVEATDDARADLERLADLLAGGDEAAVANLFMKLNTLPARIDGARKLIDALGVAIRLEREVFGIAGSGQTSDEKITVVNRVIVQAGAIAGS